MLKKWLSIFSMLFILNTQLFSQITCPSPYVYFDAGPQYSQAFIQVYDPSLPLSATNPSSTNIPLPSPIGGPHGGLALMPNISGGTLSPTFYCVAQGATNYTTNTFYYWNGQSWTDSNVSSGNINAANIAGCPGRIYAYAANIGEIYASDGISPATLIATVTPSSGPYDIVADCNCNFYILQTTNPQSLTKYSPNGVPTCSYNLVNLPAGLGFGNGGLAIIGNKVYTDSLSILRVGTISGSSVTFSTVPAFTYTVFDMASCPDCSPLSASALTDGTLSCSSNTVSVIATTTVSSVTYSWSGPGIVSGANTATAVVNAPGVYTATLLSQSNCFPAQSIVSTTVTSSQVVVTPTIFATAYTCTNVSLSVSTDIPVNSYTWNGPGIASGQGTSNISLNSTGVYSVYVSNSSNACGSATFNINAPSALNLTVAPSSFVKCSADPTSSYTLTGASAYTWSPATGITQLTPNTFLINPLSTTVYSVLGVTGLCSGSITTTFTVLPSPSISVNSGAICSGQSFTFIPSGASSYTFSGGSSIVSPTVTTTYSVAGTATNGCKNTAASEVTVHALPVIIVNSATICSGESYTIIPNGATSYTYINGGPVVSPLSNQTYSITGTGPNGCVSASPATCSVSVDSLPSIQVSTSDTLLCEGTSAFITATGANSYTWSTLSQSATIVVSPQSTSSYSVNGTGVNGCIGSAVFTQSVLSCVGLKEQREAFSISVSPNPSDGIFYLKIIPVNISFELDVYSVLGQQIINKSRNTEINLKEYSAGVYFGKINIDTKEIIIKIIKE